MGARIWNINVLQSRAVFSPIPFLFWPRLCTRFPSTCHCNSDVRFVTLQQVSSGQTFLQIFLHTNDGFLYANRAASYLISCKDLVFWLDRSSAACCAHKVLAICSEQEPLCSWGEPGNAQTLYLSILMFFLIIQTFHFKYGELVFIAVAVPLCPYAVTAATS